MLFGGLEVPSFELACGFAALCAMILVPIITLLEHELAKKTWALSLALGLAGALLTAVPSCIPSWILTAVAVASHVAGKRREPWSDANHVDMN
jgi:hypothetical protein